MGSSAWEEFGVSAVVVVLMSGEDDVKYPIWDWRLVSGGGDRGLEKRVTSATSDRVASPSNQATRI